VHDGQDRLKKRGAAKLYLKGTEEKFDSEKQKILFI
jgi:hypothetical protein